MEYRFYNPPVEDLTQRIETLERAHAELTKALESSPENKGTAKRIADTEAEHEALTAQLDQIAPTEDPIEAEAKARVEQMAKEQAIVNRVIDLAIKDERIDTTELESKLETIGEKPSE